MVLHEATDALHQAVHIAPYRPGGIAIKIVVDSATFFYIIDYKIINDSIMFTIYLNRSERALAQPLVHVALALDYKICAARRGIGSPWWGCFWCLIH